MCAAHTRAMDNGSGKSIAVCADVNGNESLGFVPIPMNLHSAMFIILSAID